jgi:toxin ParE1/3/4
MAKLRVSTAALRDLREIGSTGVREHGSAVSAAHVEGFRRLFRLLREQPFAGQERPELGSDVRCLSHRPHRIFYYVDGDTVVIDRILHHARDVGRVLRENH